MRQDQGDKTYRLCARGWSGEWSPPTEAGRQDVLNRAETLNFYKAGSYWVEDSQGNVVYSHTPKFLTFATMRSIDRLKVAAVGVAIVLVVAVVFYLSS